MIQVASKSKELGFTLVELMVVISIISILANMAIVNYKQHIEKVEDNLQKVRLDTTIRIIRTHLETSSETSVGYYYFQDSDGISKETICGLGMNDCDAGFLLPELPDDYYPIGTKVFIDSGWTVSNAFVYEITLTRCKSKLIWRWSNVGDIYYSYYDNNACT